MRAFAGQPFMDVWYAHMDVDDTISRFRSQFKAKRVKATEKMVAKAHTQTACGYWASSPPKPAGSGGSSATRR